MLLSGRRTKDEHAAFLKLQRYPHRVQLYRIPPIETIHLEEFEKLAIERLKLLKEVESAGIKHKRGSDPYEKAMDQAMRKTNLLNLSFENEGRMEEKKMQEMFSQRRADHISHFILRLAYCRSEDQKRWFMNQELDLFRYRLMKKEGVDVPSFLKAENLVYVPISEKERQEKKDKLVIKGQVKQDMAKQTEFFKIPFVEALDLIRSRQVYLEKGFAYVPSSDLVTILQGYYRSLLSQALAVSARALPSLEEEDRVVPILKNLSNQYLGDSFIGASGKGSGKISPEQIDPLSRESFPLCMRQLQQALRENHHLKHFGRLQYGLFLKGIGLSLDDALRFWRTEFTKIMEVDKFDKSYSYNVRHSYGKEGKRANYTPYSCMKIITSNPPGTGDHHGCPFKHYDGDILRQRLQAYKLSSSAIEDIMKLVKEQHYQVACVRYYELTHKIEEAGFSLQHPNQYFEESQKLLKNN
ncbi:DNA primase large subunit-like [Oscarella lobularis]|uniref:DNA primase large subunit-like n=1 Tax=Oscarella lobularis TaxID=121494 RepID=UPI003313CC13